MDKYLVKLPSTSIPLPKDNKPRSQQLKLESLKGVVVVEDLLRCKNCLEIPEQSKDEMLESLEFLQTKNPSKELLQSTGIGKTVHKLCRHSDEDVAKSSKNVYEKWKKHVIHKASKPMIEVRSDTKTEEFRLTARKWLSKSLLENKGKIAELIEREVYFASKRLVNLVYRKTIRRLTFALKDNNLREKVLNHELKVKDLVASHWKA